MDKAGKRQEAAGSQKQEIDYTLAMGLFKKFVEMCESGEFKVGIRGRATTPKMWEGITDVIKITEIETGGDSEKTWKSLKKWIDNNGNTPPASVKVFWQLYFGFLRQVVDKIEAGKIGQIGHIGHMPEVMACAPSVANRPGSPTPSVASVPSVGGRGATAGRK